MASVAYHNTTQMTGAALLEAVRAARNQDEAVLAIFERAGRPLTPSDVWRMTSDAGHRWPLTSIRRAITNLTTDERLVRLDFQRTGVYGRPEHLWAVATPQRPLFGANA